MTLKTIKELCHRGFDVRIICTVNKINVKDCLNILKIADKIGVSLVKYHICSEEGRCKDNPQLPFMPQEWIEFVENLSKFRMDYKTKILFQPSYATEKTGYQYFKEGYKGCIGRQLNKISIFPDNKMYLCSYLFDTDLNFAEMVNAQIRIRKSFSELTLFTNQNEECKKCQLSKICMGGCPAENLIRGFLICKRYPNIFSLCRLWKASL